MKRLSYRSAVTFASADDGNVKWASIFFTSFQHILPFLHLTINIAQIPFALIFKLSAAD